jgi:hypothetical protein
MEGDVNGSWSKMLLRCEVFNKKCSSVSGIRIRIRIAAYCNRNWYGHYNFLALLYGTYIVPGCLVNNI